MSLKSEEIEKLIKEAIPDAEITIQDLAGDETIILRQLNLKSLKVKVKLSNIRWYISH